MSDESSKKTLSSYVIGLILCCILTLIAFGLVELHLFSPFFLYISITILALTQFFVQCICFLRLNAGQEGRTHLLPLLFTMLIIAILASGSLWIMYNLNYHMAH